MSVIQAAACFLVSDVIFRFFQLLSRYSFRFIFPTLSSNPAPLDRVVEWFMCSWTFRVAPAYG